MNKVFRISQFLSILCLFLFFSSCTKENALPDVKKSSDEISIQKSKGYCVADMNDLDISISWSSDCLTAQVALSLCCLCTNGGTNSCVIEPGLLEIQVENAPYQYWYGDINVQSQTIPSNTCRNRFYFDVPVPEGGEQIYIIQMWFNGQNININSYTGNFC